MYKTVDKQIHVYPGNEEVKVLQYADDATVCLTHVQSVSNVFGLLSLFENCSGLKINQAKSEIPCLAQEHSIVLSTIPRSAIHSSLCLVTNGLNSHSTPTQEYKLVLMNLVLGVTLQQTSNPSREE